MEDKERQELEDLVGENEEIQELEEFTLEDIIREFSDHPYTEPAEAEQQEEKTDAEESVTEEAEELPAEEPTEEPAEEALEEPFE